MDSSERHDTYSHLREENRQLKLEIKDLKDQVMILEKIKGIAWNVKIRPQSTKKENQVVLGEDVPGTPSSDG